MWQSQSHKDRKTNSKKRNSGQGLIHIKRMNAEIEVTNTIQPDAPTRLQVRVMLNDLSPKGAELFIPSPLLAGQDMILVIEKPLKIRITAKVAWCEEYDPNSHILTHHKFSHRIRCDFLPANAEEKKMIDEICDYIQKNHLSTALIAA